eukprot:m.268427 g.268427  ORF g.268427 m.268427 type:complete len:367 (+) comp26806_c1_seq13:421-1521(+)
MAGGQEAMNVDDDAPVLVGSLDLKPHYQDLLSLALDDKFEDFAKASADFWGALPEATRTGLSDAAAVEAQEQLDGAFYETLIHRLLPDIFEMLETERTKEIRSFAKQVEQWVVAAVEGFPENFVAAKKRAVMQFGQRLRRYTGLNHLVQAAKAVLDNPVHVSQMQEDYTKVDVTAAQEQLQAICGGCPLEATSVHEASFRRLHQATNTTLDVWANWLQGVVEACMGPYKSDEQYKVMGSELLLRWSFVSSLIIRDLTLRSAASFGPFHLMRLLCDEYIYYLVEGAQRGRKPRPFALHDAPDLIMPPDDEEEEEEGGAAATAAADCEKPIRSSLFCSFVHTRALCCSAVSIFASPNSHASIPNRVLA